MARIAIYINNSKIHYKIIYRLNNVLTCIKKQILCMSGNVKSRFGVEEEYAKDNTLEHKGRVV